ncbi:MAG: NAD(P)/FAD-dependent oxidoreductase [Actinomycetota bacterium]|nr:NAD(P)/FAD-dependent oxidoreductase [Actinomycetota bacterium]
MEEMNKSKSAVPEFGERFDAVIVGAGIGGLTCGALLAKNGYKVLIIERHEKPGGFVSHYERKGFLFQIPHLISGCGDGGELRRVFDYLEMKQGFVRVEPYQCYIYPEHEIIVPSDMEAYKEKLKEQFQPQTREINRFFDAVRKVNQGLRTNLLRRPFGAALALKLLAFPFIHPRSALEVMRTRNTLENFLSRYINDDKLRTVLSTPWPWLGSPPWEASALRMITMMNAFSQGAFIPEGGFASLADELVKVFTGHGGSLLFNHEVTSINAEGGSVSEVETHPRAKFKTPIVVSDSDTKRTFLKLSQRENFTGAFLDRIDEIPLSISGFTIHLGVRKKLSEDFSRGAIFFQPTYDEKKMFENVSKLDEYPDPHMLKWFIFAPSMYEPGLAPEGKTCLDVVVPGTPYNFMKRWGVESGGKRGEKYREVKERYAERVIESLKVAFPQLVSDVEAYDASTPITFERHTMALDGCWFDSASTPRAYLLRRHGPATPLKGLYLTGSKSALGGGIHPSIMSGVLAADSIMKGELSDLL